MMMRANEDVRHVVILGGGSAGWLTAALIAREHHAGERGGLSVTLIESPNTPPIGVGEGTWPSMRDTLRRIGFSETTLVRECDASFKQGSLFRGWMHGRSAAEGDHYRHPFTLPLGFGDTDLVAGWLQRHGDRPFAEVVSAQPHVCMAGHAPKQASTPEYAAVANYGYHFDAGKFGVQLRAHAVANLHVRHVLDDVDLVVPHDDGDIAALRTRQHGDIAGDLFIDCSGMASVLLGQHYGIGLHSAKHLLFNDTALALQVPHPAPDTPIACETISTAQPAGWTWDIGLPTGAASATSTPARTCRTTRPSGNCCALHRATGGPARPPHAAPHQLRPRLPRALLASQLRRGGPVGRLRRAAGGVGAGAGGAVGRDDQRRDAGHARARWRSSSAASTTRSRTAGNAWSTSSSCTTCSAGATTRDYWREHRDPPTLPERLADLLTLWRHRAPYRQDFFRIEEVFPAASYQYVLHGMGFVPEPSARLRHPSLGDAAEPHFRETAHLARRMLGALPLQRPLIDHIRAHGLPRG